MLITYHSLSNAEVKNEWKYTTGITLPVSFSTVSLFCVEVFASPLSLLRFSFHIFGVMIGLEIYLRTIASELSIQILVVEGILCNTASLWYVTSKTNKKAVTIHLQLPSARFRYCTRSSVSMKQSQRICGGI
jgi:hypothetical protein